MENVKEKEFSLRLVDLKGGRVVYRQLNLDEFLKVAAVLGVIEWVDIK